MKTFFCYCFLLLLLKFSIHISSFIKYIEMKKIASLFVLLFSVLMIFAQEKSNLIWNKHKCAVVLTYDDGLNVHLDKVIPALNARGFKATFYIPCNSVSLSKRLEEWRKAAKQGHELGNHTIFHPCIGKKPGREWVSADNDLNDYSISKFVDEIKVANTMLRAIDGKKERTFAYTCGDMTIKDSSFVNLIKGDFVGARNVSFKYEKFDNEVLMNIGSYAVYGQKAEELIEIIKKAMETNTLVVFLFHGVGGEHSINCDENEHTKLLDFLKKNEKDIWVAPLVEVLEFIRAGNKK
jgi:peptidoglycan/xylan/chitin deacetylase (PgdA/CDA1 family)